MGAGAVVDGIYRTVAWVVAVMPPPMAIFFPPVHAAGGRRISAQSGLLHGSVLPGGGRLRAAEPHHGQGFGCNACGVTGCRIIASPRERLVAILTNCFVPCNGRFLTLIALIGLFFLGIPPEQGGVAWGRAVVCEVSAWP